MSESKLIDGLRTLARRFEEQGQYPQAYKCYKSICSLNVLPVIEAEVKLKAATMLMQHTHNTTEARQELESAAFTAQRLHADLALKCAIQSQLGRCYKLMGETQYQRAAYEKGLQICASGFAGRERQELYQWACFFYLRLADAYILEDDPTKVWDSLEKGHSLALQQNLLLNQMLFLLFKLQMATLDWDKEVAETSLREATQLLTAAEGDQTLSASEVAHIKLHLYTLKALFYIRAGQLDTLNAQEADNTGQKKLRLVRDMEELLQQVHGSCQPYEWVSPAALHIIMHLLAAVIYTPMGRSSQALDHVNEGIHRSTQCLADMGVLPTTVECHLDVYNVWECRLFLVLTFLLLECRAQVHLQCCQLVAAREDIAEAMTWVEAYPQLLSQVATSLHCLAGLYAMSTGEYGWAVAHFRALRQAVPDRLGESSVSSLLVMALTAADPPGALSEAVDVLAETSSTPEGSLGYHERAIHCVATALVRLQQGNATEAQQSLSKALKIAHSRLCNHQLVANILNCMAPLLVCSGDISGAQQMFTSGFTLAKSSQDLHAQLGALQVHQRLAELMRDPERLERSHQARAATEKKMQQRVDAALQCGASHVDILRWGLEGISHNQGD